MWKLIKIEFAKENGLSSDIFKIAEHLETEMQCQSLYFARYINRDGVFAQISLQTEHYTEDCMTHVKELFPSIQTIEVNHRNDGSHIHGFGYQICKEISLLDGPNLEEQLRDVLHWMHNMLGYGYDDEERKYLEYAERIRNRA